MPYHADETQLMSTFRGYLQTVFPACGDLLLGETKIRRQLLLEVTVPKGVHVLICNNRHALKPSTEDEIRHRRDALLNKELGYKLFSLNCEHFATFVRYGKAVCNQVSSGASVRPTWSAKTYLCSFVSYYMGLKWLCVWSRFQERLKIRSVRRQPKSLKTLWLNTIRDTDQKQKNAYMINLFRSIICKSIHLENKPLLFKLQAMEFQF